MTPKNLQLLKQAQALDLSGKALAAAAAYREFLDREPKHADSWADYSGQLLKLGRFEEAMRACETALEINPRQLAACINLGVMLMRQGRADEAERQLRLVLKADSSRMDALLILGTCLLNKRDLEGARKVLDRADQPGAMQGRYSTLQPRHAELWALLSSVLIESRNWEEAEQAGDKALRLDPSNFRARANLGSIRMEQGHLAEAEGHFRQLVAGHPNDEKARLLWITCLTRMGDSAQVVQEAAKVVQLQPNSFLVHKSVMGPYYSLGLWTEYRAEIERYRKVDPVSAYLNYEQSFVDLLFGDMPQGWRQFEARLNIPEGLRPRRTFIQPAWNGETFAGKTLLVWVEQGFGDTLMFVRYLPLVKALGGRVILEAQPALMDLAATCPGADLVIPQGASGTPFDLQASLMSLPWIFQTGLSTIPANVPYLRVPKEVPHQQEILEHLASAGNDIRIGLVWGGSPMHARDVERSIPAAALAPLGVLPGASWFSFQVGRQDIPPLPGLIPLEPLLKTFSDTAFALSAMDLLITVDTSVAHLAGALGIPTLLLLTFQPDYRWMLDRSDSPWYPTMRLYRQPTFGDWTSVLNQVVMDLTQEP